MEILEPFNPFEKSMKLLKKERLKIVPVQSPNEGRWTVILIDGSLLRQMNLKGKIKQI
jgi:hypothetical protein